MSTRRFSIYVGQGELDFRSGESTSNHWLDDKSESAYHKAIENKILSLPDCKCGICFGDTCGIVDLLLRREIFIGDKPIKTPCEKVGGCELSDPRHVERDQ